MVDIEEKNTKVENESGNADDKEVTACQLENLGKLKSDFSLIHF